MTSWSFESGVSEQGNKQGRCGAPAPGFKNTTIQNPKDKEKQQILTFTKLEPACVVDIVAWKTTEAFSWSSKQLEANFLLVDLAVNWLTIAALDWIIRF